MNEQCGYTLVEVLLSLFCNCFITLIICAMLPSIQRIKQLDFIHERGIYELQKLAHRGFVSEIEDSYIEITIGEQYLIIEENDQNLIITPGWQVLISNIEYHEFYQEGGCLYLYVEKENKETTYSLVCE